jgi:hypothetical protein
MKWTHSLLVAGLAGFVASSSWLGIPSRGNPPNFVAQEKNPLMPTKMYYGVLACSNGGCHNNPANPNQKDILLCEYDEVRIWSSQDKHKDANKVLKNERGQQMAKLLGIKGDIAKEPSCVSCHGVLVEDEKRIHKASFSLDEGVSCGACHGMAKEWVARHADFLERETWRGLSRKVKEEHFGMKDLWDPEKRATLCASCHIGNSAEGKVVTHTMYAAGHPPLPGIEMATFSDAMPRHWKYLSEKSPPVQKLLGYDPAKGDLEKTQLVVIAALVSLRESMNLLAAQAAANPPPLEKGGQGGVDQTWPELAQFDCYACHHDLKSKSWRQKRGFAGKPGRPDMRAWPTALVPLGIVQAAKGDAEKEKKLTKEMHDKMKELTAAFNAQPFGEPKLVAQAARQFSQWADGLVQELRSSRFDRPAAQKLLVGLGDESRSRLLDFDSARQLTWAFRSIQHELDPKYAANTDTAKLLKELDDQLKLDLPKGQVEITKDYLKDALEKLNNYEPEQFNQTFEQLIQKIEKQSKK